jgi:hypothetical protein
MSSQKLLPEIKKKAMPCRGALFRGGLFFGMFGYTATARPKPPFSGCATVCAYEFKPMGIPLTVVCPPEVDTPMNIVDGQDPAGRRKGRQEHEPCS